MMSLVPRMQYREVYGIPDLDTACAVGRLLTHEMPVCTYQVSEPGDRGGYPGWTVLVVGDVDPWIPARRFRWEALRERMKSA